MVSKTLGRFGKQYLEFNKPLYFLKFEANEDSNNTALFAEKIFKFFDKITDDIMKDANVHVKFVDAFLNLVNRVINSPVN